MGSYISQKSENLFKNASQRKIPLGATDHTFKSLINRQCFKIKLSILAGIAAARLFFYANPRQGSAFQLFEKSFQAYNKELVLSILVENYITILM